MFVSDHRTQRQAIYERTEAYKVEQEAKVKAILTAKDEKHEPTVPASGPYFEKVKELNANLEKQLAEIKERSAADLEALKAKHAAEAEAHKRNAPALREKPATIKENKFFNKELDDKLVNMREEHQEVKDMLMLYQASIDRDVFYNEIYNWDYGGLKPHKTSESVKAFNALVDSK